MTEQELAERCRSRDRRALKLLYERYATWMMGISMRYTGSETDSRDILHDSFIKVFGAIDRFQYRGAGSLRAWLSRIVVNTALARLKQQSGFTGLDEIRLADPAEDTDTEDATELYEQVSDEDILLCLGELPAQSRVVFNLYIFEECTHRQIAARLGITEQVSRVRLHRAKQQLAEKIRACVTKREQTK